MTIGKPGGTVAPGECCFQPNDVITSPDGRFIFVSEGHANAEVDGAGVQVRQQGKLVKTWGKLGTGPGEFDQPHALAFDSKGRLFIGDRNNNRVQVFDQEGNFISEHRQWSRPSGIFIDKNDVLYSADSESDSVSRNHPGWKRGIRWAASRTRRSQLYPTPTRMPPARAQRKASSSIRWATCRRRSWTESRQEVPEEVRSGLNRVIG
jgi:hypothetical protein